MHIPIGKDEAGAPVGASLVGTQGADGLLLVRGAGRTHAAAQLLQRLFPRGYFAAAASLEQQVV